VGGSGSGEKKAEIAREKKTDRGRLNRKRTRRTCKKDDCESGGIGGLSREPLKTKGGGRESVCEVRKGKEERKPTNEWLRHHC